MRQAILVSGGLVILAALVGAQTPARIRDAREGAYTSAQAVRGKAVFDESCASCHGTDLSGGAYEGDIVPALRRDDFMNGANAGRLLQRVKRLMPRDAPGALSDAAYADVLAFLMQENGFPPGQSDLPSDIAALEELTLEKTETAPNFSLVRSAGCLTAAPDGWQLTRSSEPKLSDQSQATSRDVEAAVASPLGTATFRLMNVAAHVSAKAGEKVLVTGLLILEQNGDDRLNVIALQTTGVACG